MIFVQYILLHTTYVLSLTFFSSLSLVYYFRNPNLHYFEKFHVFLHSIQLKLLKFKYSPKLFDFYTISSFNFHVSLIFYHFKSLVFVMKT